MLRRLIADCREFPATSGLSALWVLVFLAMVVSRARSPQGLSGGELILGLRGGHRFGELTLRDLFAGEVWRAVTATFVHYGLLHIGLNLLAFYQLGCLVESWYGTGQFLAIYVLTGGGGNLLSAIVRRALHENPTIPSGGGSTVVMGLVGLCAVVGWRARTRVGDYLRNQMILAIVLTAGLGIVVALAWQPIIDNWGHAGGTIMGALIGLANRGMVHQVGRAGALWAGSFGALVLVACAGAQVAENGVEVKRQGMTAAQVARRVALDDELRRRLDEVRQVFSAVANPKAITRGKFVRKYQNRPRLSPLKPIPQPNPEPPAVDATNPPLSPLAPGVAAAAPTVAIDPEQLLYVTGVAASARSLDAMAGALDTGENSHDYRRAMRIIAQCHREPPTREEIVEFDELLSAIQTRLVQDRMAVTARFRAEAAQSSGP